MTVPSSITQLLILLVLVVPGFVYQTVRIRLRGRTPSDTELSTRILLAIIGSTFFALVYVLVLGPYLADAVDLKREDLLDHPRLAAIAGLLAAIGIPGAVALLQVLVPRFLAWIGGKSDWWATVTSSDLWKRATAPLRPANWSRVDSRPSSWDVAFSAASPGYVRVRVQNGTWYAGWFGENSYASSFPDPQSLFVERSFQVTADGEITGEVPNSVGAVIDCREAVLVELLAPAEEPAVVDQASETASRVHGTLTLEVTMAKTQTTTAVLPPRHGGYRAVPAAPGSKSRRQPLPPPPKGKGGGSSVKSS